MKTTLSIRPSRELRNNYPQISSMAKINPIAITVNGKEDVVIVSHKDYMEQQEYIAQLEARIELYSELSKGLTSIKEGNVLTREQVELELEDTLNELEYEL